MCKKGLFLMTMLLAMAYFIQASPGYLIWEFRIATGTISSSPAIGSDGTIYVGSSDNKLYAINNNGTEKWSFLTNGYISTSPAIGSDGTIYVKSSDNWIYAISPDGTKKWEYLIGAGVSSPAIGSDGTIYVGSSDNKLYAINPNGTKKWEFLTGDAITSSPAIGNDGTIYIGSSDNKIYAINSDGTKKWEYLIGGNGRSPVAIASDGTIYVGSEDQKLYAMNADGTQKWDFYTGDTVESSPLIDIDGTIYFASDNGTLYALNPDGTKKWEFQNTHGGNSPVIGRNGTIYKWNRTWDNTEKKYYGRLFAINPDGTKKWEFQTEYSPSGSSPVLAHDGTMYVGTAEGLNGGRLYAIETDSEGLADSPWPMFGADVRHTANRQMLTPESLVLDYNTETHLVTLTWSDDSLCETGYEIEESTDGENYTKIGETAADVLTYQFTYVEPCSNSYRVRAVYSYGTSGYSNVVNLDISGVYGYLVPNDIVWGRCKVYIRTAGPEIQASDLYITVDNDSTQYAMTYITGGFQSGTAFNGRTFTDTSAAVKVWLNGELYDTMDVTEGGLYPGAQLSFEGLQFTSASEGGRVLLYEMKPGVEKPGSTVKSFSVRINGDGALKMDNPLGESGALLHYMDGQWTCVSYGKEELVFNRDGDYALVNDTAGNYIPRITGNALKQNYPNPFNPETNIDFELEEGGYVTLEIFDSRGRKVITLAEGDYSPGIHTVHWAGKDSRGCECASGIYYCILKVNGKRHIKKMVLLK